MANEFDNFDLRSELDDEAFNILSQGDSDLAFGGSSEQEAEIFGKDISASDAPRIGAFLGGVALANLKVQNQRAERFARIRSLQDEILKREQQTLARDRLDADIADDIRSNATTERGQDLTLTSAREGRTTTERGQDLTLTSAREGRTTTERGQDLTLTSAREGRTTTERGQDLNLTEAELKQNKLDIRTKNIESLLNSGEYELSDLSRASDEVLQVEANNLERKAQLINTLQKARISTTRQDLGGREIPLSISELQQKSNELAKKRIANATNLLKSKNIPLTVTDAQGNERAMTNEEVVAQAVNVLKQEQSGQ